MPIAIGTLKTKILNAMTSEGFTVTGTHSFADKFATALATAIVGEFTDESDYNAHTHVSAAPGNPSSGPTPTPQ